MTELDMILRPKSVAIIGASRSVDKIGHILVKNMLDSGFQGKIFPVNPNAEEILGLRCYKDIQQISDEIDLAVIAIPAPQVLESAVACGKKGVKAIIVISAGFKETGLVGASMERELLQVCQKFGMRMQGPNCLGVINAYLPLNLTFAASIPRQGAIGFISQSGALGTAVMDWAIKEGIGFASFVSLGNKADLDEIDFIEAMANEPHIRVILLYVESIEEGQRFMRVASQAMRKKPIIVLKGGASSAGAKAASSHTGAMVGSITAYQTAFRQSGVLMLQSVEELFDIATAFSTQPLPRDNSVAIVTNGGGPGILATDVCETLGVKVPRVSEETMRELSEKLPPSSSIQNPIDILGDARSDRYKSAVKAVLADPSIGSVLVILTPQAVTESLETAQAIVALAKNQSKPLLPVFMGGVSVDRASRYLRENGSEF